MRVKQGELKVIKVERAKIIQEIHQGSLRNLSVFVKVEYFFKFVTSLVKLKSLNNYNLSEVLKIYFHDYTIKETQGQSLCNTIVMFCYLSMPWKGGPVGQPG